MRILVTGAKGFIGKNLIAGLKNHKLTDVDEFDKDTDLSLLEEYCKVADFVYHLAGSNRPDNESEYRENNTEFTDVLLTTLKKYKNYCPVMFASSIQVYLENPYGKSKKAAEEFLLQYSGETGAKVYIYRFPNVFGKWSKPNYNSAVATFCYNVSHDLPITINNPDSVMKLIYIDDLVDELIRAAQGKANSVGNYCEVPVFHIIPLQKLADLIRSFRRSRNDLTIPDMSDDLTKKLYSTYLSYLPENDLSYGLSMHIDQRGSFTEFIKQTKLGQLSVNISKPGILRGNHWHSSKNEKFLVVSGKGVIRLRKMNTEEVINYYVTGDKLEVVDIPAGYIHNIENLGEADMVTLIWANESFDQNNPDTFYMEV